MRLMVIFGALGLLPILWIGFIVVSIGAQIAPHVLMSLQWTSSESFWDSLVRGNILLPPPLNLAPFVLVLVVMYLLLFWQWVASAFRRRTFLRPRRLWMVTAIYFGAFLSFNQIFFFGLLGNDEISVDDPRTWLRWWFVVGCGIPLAFVVLSMRLWQLTPDLCDEWEDDRV